VGIQSTLRTSKEAEVKMADATFKDEETLDNARFPTIDHHENVKFTADTPALNGT
jgi:hypothetical protein